MRPTLSYHRSKPKDVRETQISLRLSICSLILSGISFGTILFSVQFTRGRALLPLNIALILGSVAMLCACFANVSRGNRAGNLLWFVAIGFLASLLAILSSLLCPFLS